tara:strand:+ start:12668 stop:12862 length:195 start_codon:yes stop_codon:yes gene_type:complete
MTFSSSSLSAFSNITLLHLAISSFGRSGVVVTIAYHAEKSKHSTAGERLGSLPMAVLLLALLVG